jgi:hypothetical protein
MARTVGGWLTVKRAILKLKRGKYYMKYLVVLIILLHTFASVSYADNNQTVSVKIAHPQNRTIVDSNEVALKGTSSGLDDNAYSITFHKKTVISTMGRNLSILLIQNKISRSTRNDKL